MQSLESSKSLCHACKQLKLCFSDFIHEPQIQAGTDDKQLARYVSIGSLDAIISRPFCPLCRLAKTIWQMDIEPVHQNWGWDSRQNCVISLYYGNSFWDDEIHKERSAMFLGFTFSDYPDVFEDLSTVFTPTIENAISGAGISQFFGRSLPRIEDKFELISGWLSKCQHEHGPMCNGDYTPLDELPSLLLVDVWNYSLVEASPNSAFVALSYVWGVHSFSGTRKASLDKFKQPGALNRVGDLLPKTISDAILLVRGVKRQFLWVDLLCIVQDDSNQKHSLIMSMDRIFSGALFTIIAMTGKDANAGLFDHGITSEGLETSITTDLCLVPIKNYTMTPSRKNWFHEGRAWT